MGKQQQTKMELDNRSHINAFKTNNVAQKFKIIHILNTIPLYHKFNLIN